MTAVAPPPLFGQSMPRSTWTNSAQTGSMTQMTPEEVSRLLMPPRTTKTVTRPSSSSSISSLSSNDSNATATGSNWAKKKPARNGWPNKTAEGNLRPNGTAGSVLNNATANGVPVTGSNGTLNSYLMLLPLNGTFERKIIPLPYFPDILRIGRQTNAKTIPSQSNGFFDSKVLSRQHAEIWAEKGTGRVYIRDIKSSNGTFVNGQRLSAENRESDPHEIRAEDILELGIDIVGEDNKTIVHHKVAARVEHAGLHPGNNGNNGSGFDLNFGDIDPIVGGGLMAPPVNHVQTGGRGRSNSQSSRASGVTFAGNGMGPRQTNIMSSLPVTMESIVKKLHFELQQARQQSNDIKRTSEMLDKLLSKPKMAATASALGDGDAPKIDTTSEILVPDVADHDHTQSERPIMKEIQPLPALPRTPPPEAEIPYTEKKMGDITSLSEKIQQITSDTIASSPISIKSSSIDPPQQVMGLVTALATAQKDLEEKSLRVQELEETLKKERLARESAEVRAEKLELASITSRTMSKAQELQPVIASNDTRDMSSQSSPEPNIRLEKERELDVDRTAIIAEAAAKLQSQVDSMLIELKNTKSELETYKKRAILAETEKAVLAEQIKMDEEARSKLVNVNTNGTAVLGMNRGISMGQRGSSNGDLGVMNQVLTMSILDRKQAVAGGGSVDMAILAKQGAPYMSIIGVVIFGVGLIAVLNGWQKGDR